MPIYKVADIVFETEPKYDLFKNRIAKYEYLGDAEPSMKINISDEDLRKTYYAENFSCGDTEYMLTGKIFYTHLLKNNGIMLHSSAIIYKGGAYLFSADSGTGKSTHTGIWQRVFGKDNVRILNDDKPAIRIFGDEVFAYGTPWSGKYDINLNEKAPLKAVVFLERDTRNHIEKIDAKQAFQLFFPQTIRKVSEEYMNYVFDVSNKLFKLVPMYKMGCNMDDEAALIAESAVCTDI